MEEPKHSHNKKEETSIMSQKKEQNSEMHSQNAEARKSMVEVKKMMPPRNDKIKII